MLELTRTSKDRTDVNRTITRSIDIPGHEDRLKAHCERVQEEYFDSGLYHKDMHPKQKLLENLEVSVRDMVRESFND
jgi:hypothetical protein